MGKILEELGIFGIPESIENSILASLVLGDPAIMIGAPGTAKTDAAQMLGSALREASKRKYPEEEEKWFTAQIYDASKIEYEDLLGLPDVLGMNEEKGKKKALKFIETPTTIWGKRLVCYDEFNRTNPDRQSNLLEHIRSRSIQGLPTGTSFILAAMNPYGDTGTEELSDALVDRFLFYLKFPEFNDMPFSVKEAIIDRIGQSDCVALKKHWTNQDSSLKALDVTDRDDSGELIINEKLANVGDSIHEILKKSMDLYGALQKSVGTSVTALIRQTFDSLNAEIGGSESTEERASLLSGRRAGLVKRGLLAHRAVELAKSLTHSTTVRSMLDMLREIYPTCMPFGVSGRESEDTVEKQKSRLYNDITSFWPIIEKEGADSILTDVVYELFGTSSIHRQMYILLKYGNSLNKAVASERWAELLGKADAALHEVLQLVKVHIPNILPENINLKAPTEVQNKHENSTILEFTLDSHLSDCGKDVENLLSLWQNRPIENYFVRSSLHAALMKDKDVAKKTPERKMSRLSFKNVIYDIDAAASQLRLLLKGHVKEGSYV
ncbi:MAG: AAA family ATPase [Candidatus Thorarchaeota archaeon]|jgi:hypothetical protein